MPSTKLGKWSLGLIALFFVLFGVGQILATTTGGGGGTFSDNLPLAIIMFSAGGAGVLAFAVGLIAVMKKHERSWLVYIAALIGFLIFAFVAGEFFGPAH